MLWPACMHTRLAQYLGLLTQMSVTVSGSPTLLNYDLIFKKNTLVTLKRGSPVFDEPANQGNFCSAESLAMVHVMVQLHVNTMLRSGGLAASYLIDPPLPATMAFNRTCTLSEL